MTTVMIMAGGTGGHVFPALAVADALRKRGVRVVWLGTEKGLESRVVPAAGIELLPMQVSGLRGRGLKGWLKAPFTVLRAVAQAMTRIRASRPRVVLGFGGYVGGPGALAARCLGCPVVLHEQNAIAGMTNRYLKPLAKRVLTGFDGVMGPSRKVIWTGNPVREAIAGLSHQRRESRDGQRPRLLVVGGSLGARGLNLNVAKALAELPEAERPEVCHQSGERGLDEARTAYAEAGVKAAVVAFIDDMAEAYRWADIIICRAGALTVAEVACAGLPAIFVPFPHAVDDHQTANAAYLVDRGAALLLPQTALEAGALGAALEQLLDPDRRREMSQKALSMARPDAAERVADICMEVAA